MDYAEKIEITFKNGETISYGKDEWDDYAFDGNAVIVKNKGAWIGIYNFDHVFCVQLKHTSPTTQSDAEGYRCLLMKDQQHYKEKLRAELEGISLSGDTK